MRHLLFTLLLCSLPSVTFAQNVVRLVRGIFTYRQPAVYRSITVPISRFYLADQVVRAHSYNTRAYMDSKSSKIEYHLERTLASQVLRSPTHEFGPYMQNKVVARAALNEKYVHRAHIEAWKEINKTGGYNGAHHFINKYTLSMIHKDLKDKGIKVNLSDMQKNAPAIFHPLHGDPEFEKVFHDAKWQYDTYINEGMEALMLYQLQKIHELNDAMGLEPMPDEVIRGLLAEGQLWCDHYHMYWHHPSTYHVPAPTWFEVE